MPTKKATPAQATACASTEAARKGTATRLIDALAVLLKQQGPWTYGALANHLWSFAGGDGRADIAAPVLPAD